MTTIADLCRDLDAQFPEPLAESWDNTGLLLGDRHRDCRKIMTCLTITPTSLNEAIERRADLIVSHHPLPFRPLGRITTDSNVGKLLWELIGARIAVYSPHTRFDSARFGINQFLAERFGLCQAEPLVPHPQHEFDGLGSGRIGRWSAASGWNEFVRAVKSAFGQDSIRGVAAGKPQIERVAIACGSGGSLVPAAIDRGCDALVTGELNFHACLECQSHGIGVVLLGHFASERFAVERLAAALHNSFADLEVWASQHEADPIVAL